MNFITKVLEIYVYSVYYLREKFQVGNTKRSNLVTLATNYCEKVVVPQ